jgi:hypothetical protein
MTTPAELQTLALKIARHRWPEYTPDPDDTALDLFEDSAYTIWQEIAPKYVSMLIAKNFPGATTRIPEFSAKADAYEASLTPLGIAKAYCEVYGLED